MSAALLIILAILFATAFTDKETCGMIKSNTDVTNGDETTYGEFPWLAALEYKMRGSQYIVGIKCGGAVINKRFVLTAAQCLNLKNFEIYSAWLGVRKLQIQHENYDPYKLINDIALLKLASDITFSDYIRPICLPDENSALPSSGTALTISGWGQIGLCGPTTDIKLKAQLPLYSHADCIDKWNVSVRADQICTDGQSLQSSRWRDIGAPIMESRPISLDRQWFATGIVTSNDGCSYQNPVTHTRVSSYAYWIAKKISRS